MACCLLDLHVPLSSFSQISSAWNAFQTGTKDTSLLKLKIRPHCIFIAHFSQYVLSLQFEFDVSTWMEGRSDYSISAFRWYSCKVFSDGRFFRFAEKIARQSFAFRNAEEKGTLFLECRLYTHLFFFGRMYSILKLFPSFLITINKFRVGWNTLRNHLSYSFC